MSTSRNSSPFHDSGPNRNQKTDRNPDQSRTANQDRTSASSSKRDTFPENSGYKTRHHAPDLSDSMEIDLWDPKSLDLYSTREKSGRFARYKNRRKAKKDASSSTASLRTDPAVAESSRSDSHSPLKTSIKQEAGAGTDSKTDSRPGAQIPAESGSNPVKGAVSAFTSGSSSIAASVPSSDSSKNSDPAKQNAKKLKPAWNPENQNSRDSGDAAKISRLTPQEDTGLNADSALQVPAKSVTTENPDSSRDRHAGPDLQSSRKPGKSTENPDASTSLKQSLLKDSQNSGTTRSDAVPLDYKQMRFATGKMQHWDEIQASSHLANLQPGIYERVTAELETGESEVIHTRQYIPPARIMTFTATPAAPAINTEEKKSGFRQKLFGRKNKPRSIEADTNLTADHSDQKSGIDSSDSSNQKKAEKRLSRREKSEAANAAVKAPLPSRTSRKENLSRSDSSSAASRTSAEPSQTSASLRSDPKAGKVSKGDKTAGNDIQADNDINTSIQTPIQASIQPEQADQIASSKNLKQTRNKISKSTVPSDSAVQSKEDKPEQTLNSSNPEGSGSGTTIRNQKAKKEKTEKKEKKEKDKAPAVSTLNPAKDSTTEADSVKTVRADIAGTGGVKADRAAAHGTSSKQTEEMPAPTSLSDAAEASAGPSKLEAQTIHAIADTAGMNAAAVAAIARSVQNHAAASSSIPQAKSTAKGPFSPAGTQPQSTAGPDETGRALNTRSAARTAQPVSAPSAAAESSASTRKPESNSAVLQQNSPSAKASGSRSLASQSATQAGSANNRSGKNESQADHSSARTSRMKARRSAAGIRSAASIPNSKADSVQTRLNPAVQTQPAQSQVQNARVSASAQATSASRPDNHGSASARPEQNRNQIRQSSSPARKLPAGEPAVSSLQNTRRKQKPVQTRHRTSKAVLEKIRKVPCLLIQVVILAAICIFWFPDLNTSTIYSSADFNTVLSSLQETAGKDNYPEAEAVTLKRAFGLDPDSFENILFLRSMDAMQAGELLLCRSEDEDQLQAFEQSARNRQNAQYEVYESYAPAQAALVRDALIDVQGNYALYYVGDNTAEIQALFEDLLTGEAA